MPRSLGHHAFDPFDRGGIQPGEVGGKIYGRRPRILLDAVHQPRGERLLRADGAHRKAHIQRAPPPHEGRQPPGRDRQTVPGSGDAQLRLWSGDPQVPGDGELHPRADRGPVYSHDYRDRKPHHLLVELVEQIAHLRSLGVFEVEVRTGTERLRRRGTEDDGTRLDAIEGRVQGAHEDHVDGVQPIGAVEAQA